MLAHAHAHATHTTTQVRRRHKHTRVSCHANKFNASQFRKPCVEHIDAARDLLDNLEKKHDRMVNLIKDLKGQQEEARASKVVSLHASLMDLFDVELKLIEKVLSYDFNDEVSSDDDKKSVDQDAVPQEDLFPAAGPYDTDTNTQAITVFVKKIE